jgi:hypothetical protein
MDELLKFILDIDFMSTKEFCNNYNIPTPLSKSKSSEELAFEFITLDAIKYKMLVEKAKEVKNKIKGKWIDIEKQKPLAWEKGEWDGNRTDFVLIATDKQEILIARAYENFIGGIHTLDWYQKDDFDVKGNVTHWQKLSEHPIFIS